MGLSFGRHLGRKKTGSVALACVHGKEKAGEIVLHEGRPNQNSGSSSSCSQHAVSSSKISLDLTKLMDVKKVPFERPDGSSSH